jgi:hypothetical protein
MLTFDSEPEIHQMTKRRISFPLLLRMSARSGMDNASFVNVETRKQQNISIPKAKRSAVKPYSQVYGHCNLLLVKYFPRLG